MDDDKAQKILKIQSIFQEELSFNWDSSNKKRQYSDLLKSYCVQFGLDFGEYASLARAIGINKNMIRKWLVTHRKDQKEKELSGFKLVKIVYGDPLGIRTFKVS